jgi:membrane-bound lytic murein transglycosylase MltF
MAGSNRIQPAAGMNMLIPYLIRKTIPVLLSLALFALGSAGTSLAKEPHISPDDKLLAKATKASFGDLDKIVERRTLRVLVAFNKTNFFLDGPRTRGATYEMMTMFDKHLNKILKKRHLKVHLVFIPVERDKLLPDLIAGKGDIATASLTVTSRRKKQVDFAAPLYKEAKEVVVTSPSAPKLQSLDDLSGKTVYVRKSSSYFQSLQKLNKKLKAAGKKPVDIQPVNELLETEDILEMVNADLFSITVADDYLADFWKKIFTSMKVHDNLALRTGGNIAWAIRKKSPKLKKALDGFVKKVKVGTRLGNIISKRYFENTRFARNALAPQEMERFKHTIKYFKKYASKYSFDWLMLASLGYQESGLDQSKRSPRGAVGVMQLLPSTAASPPVNIPGIQKLDQNIHAGVKYLRYIYNRYYKDQPMSRLDKVLFTFASYNAGPARVAGLRSRARKMGLDPNKWFRNVEVAAAKAIGRETVQYVSNIFKYYLAYSLITSKAVQKKVLIKEIKQK